MKHQPLFDYIQKETGLDFSRNRGVKAYLAHLDKPNSAKFGVIIRTLYKAFQPYGDNTTAMAAAIICANKYLNGGQIAGFGTYFQIINGERLKGIKKSGNILPGTGNGQRSKHTWVFILPEEQLLQVTSDPEQARKTFHAIKPETLEKYRQVIHATNRFRARKEQPPHGKAISKMGAQPILHQLPIR